MKKLLFYFLILIHFTNCKEKEFISKYGCSGSNYYVRQSALGITFKDSQTLFNKYPKDSIKFGFYTKPLVYYLNNISNARTYLTYTIITTNFDNQFPQYFLSIGEIPELSAINNIKKFYLDWPNGQTDSIFADYFDVSTPYDNECCCATPLQSLLLNNKTYISKSPYDSNGIFIFED
jgi:hypothetical protein